MVGVWLECWKTRSYTQSHRKLIPHLSAECEQLFASLMAEPLAGRMMQIKVTFEYVKMHMNAAGPKLTKFIWAGHDDVSYSITLWSWTTLDRQPMKIIKYIKCIVLIVYFGSHGSYIIFLAFCFGCRIKVLNITTYLLLPVTCKKFVVRIIWGVHRILELTS